MSAASPMDVSPRSRTPFRTGFDGPPAPAGTAPSGVRYSAATEDPGDDRDILFGYQIFLGRDPENSFVITDGKSNRLRGFLHGLVTSPECRGAVFTPLLSGRKLPHENVSPGPTAVQVEWLLGLYEGDADFIRSVREATTWRALWRALAVVPDFPSDQAESIAAAPATPDIHPADAAAGFVLINVDQPKPAEKLHPGAILTGSGWAIAPDDIVQITVHLDDMLLCHARHGLPRPDVARNFPHYRHVDSCGFAFTTTLPQDLPASPASLLRLHVTTKGGHSGDKTVAVAITGNTEPSRTEAWPLRLAIEDARVDESGELRLRGHVLSMAKLDSLAVFLADQPLGVAQPGLSRPDVESLHPDYPNAADSGFVFSAHLAGEPEGPASVRVQATDSQGHQRQAIIPIAIPRLAAGSAGRRRKRRGTDTAIVPASSAHMRLEVDKPLLDGDAAQAPVRGALSISGWVVAPEGIECVDVFCDDAPLGRAYLGMRREDIARAFPDHEGALLSGFAMVLPPGSLAVGTRLIRLSARSRAGAVLARDFTVQVDAHDAPLASATIRTTMPRAEIAFAESLLARRGCRPDFIAIIRAETLDGLEVTLASLERQAYPAWAAAVVLPGSKAVASARSLTAGRFAANAARIAFHTEKTLRLPESSGSLLTVLHAGDELSCDALLEMAIAQALSPAAGFLYADEHRPDPCQPRDHPFFKPDWSPQLLLGMNYIGRPWCATGAAVRAASLSATALATGSDYDLVLKLTAAAIGIVHIDRLLLRRGTYQETAASEAIAVKAFLRRNGTDASVEPAGPGTWRARRRLPMTERVSIIMPTCGGGGGLVQQAIASIRATTPGLDVEILVVDNVPARNKTLKTWLRRHADTVVDMPGAFNWSGFNNRGATYATGSTLLFLNDDIEARESGWLEALLEQTQLPEVGVVGARLLYPDGKIQHAGQFLAETHARHAFRFAEGNDPGPFGLATVTREVSSVTGACFAVRRDVFDRLGGFDTAHSVVNNDLDFCLKARAAGLSVIYTPHATLMHHELASRADIEDTFDIARFDGAWRRTFLLGDPYHSPRLLPDADHYAPETEPVVRIHVGPAGPARDDVTSILAIKLDHIGDFLTSIPALRALKRRFPKARLSLLCPPATAALASRESCVDETIEFTFFHAVSGRGQLGVSEEILDALLARLAPYRFDMAIDLRMQPETRAVLRYTGAPFLSGYDHDGRFPFLHVALEWEGDTALLRKRQHISERLVQLVAATAEACRPTAPCAPSPQIDPWSVPVLAALPAGFLDRPLVCVHPGVGNAVRQWPAAHYAALIDLLTQEAGLHAVLIGGGDEAPVAEQILRQVTAKHAVVSLVGQVRLEGLSALMESCALFVGNNSGPKHLAAALGVPTLGIHSAVVDAVEWGPLGTAAFALRRNVVCGPCYLEFASDCPRAMACLTGIKPRDAYAACLRLLALRDASAAADGTGKQGAQHFAITNDRILVAHKATAG